MRVLLISPYHSGSHKAWADGYKHNSGHEVHIVSLPGRFWKWRMAGSALTLSHLTAEFIETVGQPDVVIATDMMELDSFLGASRRFLGDPKVVLYMHENQLTYPISAAAKPDLSYGFRNWKSMATADEIWFNSQFHRSEVSEALPKLLNNFPDNKHASHLEQVMGRTRVMPVGIELVEPGLKTHPPLIMWNHRWEYDKNPGALFDALDQTLHLRWRLALCGENFRKAPQEFLDARDRYGDRIIQFGHAERPHYLKLLQESSLVISTSNHEFFGISVVEAVSAGALPLLPNQLSYPEIIPEGFHSDCLYEGEELPQKLADVLSSPQQITSKSEGLADSMQRFGWDTIAPKYDASLEELVLK